MARSERPLDDSDPWAPVARRLRDLRRASRQTYTQLSLKAGYSAVALSMAASTGNGRIPSWDKVHAYLKACGITDPCEFGQWRRDYDGAVEVARHIPTPRLSTPIGSFSPPATMQTWPEFAAALRMLRAATDLTIREVVKASGSALSNSTVGDLLNGRIRPTERTVKLFVDACGTRIPVDSEEWLVAWRLIQAGQGRAHQLKEIGPIQLANAGFGEVWQADDERNSFPEGQGDEHLSVRMRHGGPVGVSELARQGLLAGYYVTASTAERRRLRVDAYDLLVPVVFTQFTRRVEARRGHRDCMVGIGKLRSDCLDRFHDDMDAILDDFFHSARTPIENLEGWVSRRLMAVTIDAHRRRRGERGALQRPRIPRWLADELQHDQQLMDLALRMLEWVGVEATAGMHDWPIEIWSAQRVTDGDNYESASRSVAHDVAIIVAAMRKRPRWYADYVERPMGHKRPPMAVGHRDAAEAGSDPAEAAIDADAADDARRVGLAELAISLVRARAEHGEDLRTMVVDVIATLFGSGSGSEDLDRVPGVGGTDYERVNARLADPETVDHVVAVVLDILGR